MKPTQILLTFETKEDAEYVKTVMRRRATTLESYILDNFEWDGVLPCMCELPGCGVNVKTCEECDNFEKCPDSCLESGK